MNVKTAFTLAVFLFSLGFCRFAHAGIPGWEEQEVVFDYSPFWLPSGYREVIEVEAPDTASKFRIYFDEIWVQSECDSVVIYNEDYTGDEKTEEERQEKELQRIQGIHFGLLSRVIYGQKAKIVVETEACSRWELFHFVSFRTRAIYHRGCVHNPPIQTGMSSARSCWNLKHEVTRRAVADVRQRFSEGSFWKPIGPNPFEAELGGIGEDGKFFKSADKMPEHSETNVQVAGVDEADIVKTDGNFIYSLRGEEILIYSVWPAEEAHLAHRLPIQGHGMGLHLYENQLIALSDVFFTEDETAMMGMPEGPTSFTKVTVFRLGDMPAVTSEWLLSGYFQTARLMEGSLRLFLGGNIQMPDIQDYPEDAKWGTPEYEEALSILEERAVHTVSTRSLRDWLPRHYRVFQGRPHPIWNRCRDYSFQKGARDLDMTSVVTLDLSSSWPTTQISTIFANPDHVYQSHENIYLASDHRWSCRSDRRERGQFTYIHKMDASHPRRVAYRASGVIEGSLANQFALDEYKGFLRVAATNEIGLRIFGVDPQTSNRVYVLEQEGTALKKASELELHAPGERIMSSRFMEDDGYVVTFRRVDPLFTIDLSDPYAPRVMGELTVTGFSTYLHRLGDDHLFTIGQEVDPDEPWISNVALSIFDVSERSRPSLVNRFDIGTRFGHSEALWEHKAFTMYSREGEDFAYLAIPFTDIQETDQDDVFWRQFISTLKVFKVKDLTVTEWGEVDHSGLYRQHNQRRWGWWYQPHIRRGVFVDNYVFAVSDAGIRVTSLDEIDRPVAEVAVEPKIPDLPTFAGVGKKLPEKNSLDEKEPFGEFEPVGEGESADEEGFVGKFELGDD